MTEVPTTFTWPFTGAQVLDAIRKIVTEAEFEWDRLSRDLLTDAERQIIAEEQEHKRDLTKQYGDDAVIAGSYWHSWKHARMRGQRARVERYTTLAGAYAIDPDRVFELTAADIEFFELGAAWWST